MTIAAQKVAAEILALPASVRAYLAHQLIASLDEDADETAESEWESVIDRRTREIRAGTVVCRSLSEVTDKIRTQLHARRSRPSRG